MKRTPVAVLLAFGLFFTAVPQNIYSQTAAPVEKFDDEGDDYDGGDFYEEEEKRLTQNGAGDQYLDIGLMPIFPLNFGNQLYVGGGLTVGYHRFLTQYIAVGGNLMFSYNSTIGSNVLTMIPIMVGVTFQPYVGHFEFPITFNIGAAVENYVQYSYFPGLIIKGDAGCFYRINENWSAGGQISVMWLPQWTGDKSKDGSYSALAVMIAARYHF